MPAKTLSRKTGEWRATWNIVTEHLPPLASAIKNLIAEAERREAG